jgi:hypothetical protein
MKDLLNLLIIKMGGIDIDFCELLFFFLPQFLNENIFIQTPERLGETCDNELFLML